MNDCLFCQIIKGEIPCQKVYENDQVLAFLDINPINPGHVLVVPKRHSQDLFDASDEDLCDVIKAVKKVAIAVKDSMGYDGICLGQNNGEAAGQVVPHFHFHVMPRQVNDGHRHWQGTPYDDGEVEEIRQKIADQLH